MGRSIWFERHRLNKRAMRDGCPTPRQVRLNRLRLRECLHPQSTRMMLSGYHGCGLCGARTISPTPTSETSHNEA